MSDDYCRWCRFIEMIRMELCNEFLSVFDIFDGFPGVFFGGITFPVYQVFDLASIYLRISDFFYIVFWFSFDMDRWWRRGFLLIAILCRFVWGKIGFIEIRVNGRPSIGEFELVG
jgi:hypothetical protein